MIKISRIMLFFALGGLPCVSFADDLLDIYRLAATSDPQLRAAEAERLAIQEIRPQSRALLFPSVNLTANGGINRQDLTLPATRGADGSRAGGGDISTFTSHGFALNLVQPVYNRGTKAALRQADARIGQADAIYAVAQQELILRVATRYFDVLAALDNLSFARAEKIAIARQLEQSVQRFEVGLIAVTDVNEAQARYDLAVAQEISADNAVASTREALLEVTGDYPEQLDVLRADIPLPSPDPTDIEQWADAALRQNFQISAAEFAAQVAREEIERQRARRFPTLEIVGTHSFADSGGGRFGGSQIDSDSITLQLNAPIYEGGLTNSRTREAQFRHTQARELLEQQQRAVLRQTRAAYLNVLANISRVDALKEAVRSNQSRVDATQAGLDVGIRTAVDLLDAQRELFRARSEYARARYDYILENLRLKQATGILSVPDLEQTNALLTDAPAPAEAIKKP